MFNVAAHAFYHVEKEASDDALHVSDPSQVMHRPILEPRTRTFGPTQAWHMSDLVVRSGLCISGCVPS